MEAVTEIDRHQLLRRPSPLDHPVQLGCAIAETSRQAQGSAMERRETEARAKSDSIGPETEIPLNEAETLLCNGKAFAQPPRIPIGTAQAVSNGRSQTDVLGLVGAPNCL
jgi:hypothetical protein